MDFNKVAETKPMLKRVTGYEFGEDQFLLEAIDTTGLRISQSNQRLALLGDIVLKHVILDEWYPTGKPKGAGNALVSNIGSNSNLAAVASRIGLKNLIITNPGHCGPISQGMLATAMEAILGAIYLDCDKDMTSMKSVMSALDSKAS